MEKGCEKKLTFLQARTAQAIICVFETGRPQPDYGRVTYLPGDYGQLSYGRSQFTLTSGSLYLLIKSFTAQMAEQKHPRVEHPLAAYLPQFEAADPALNYDLTLRALLQDAAHDPAMQKAQDQLAQRFYWTPACNEAARFGLHEPLAITIVYDSIVHGSWPLIRRRTSDKHGEPQNIGARDWALCYIKERRAWLIGHKNQLLHHTAYRMRALKRLAEQGNWRLDLPLSVRGITIDRAAVCQRPPQPALAAQAPLLRLTQPPLESPEIAQIAALVGAPQQNVFNRVLEGHIKKFQAENGLVCDGIVGPATRAALGI